MKDLSQETIEDLATNGNGPFEAQMAAELKRRRAEQAAAREHVEQVVREVCRRVLVHPVDAGNAHGVGDAIARHVTYRLSAPVMSSDDKARLARMRTAQVVARAIASSLTDTGIASNDEAANILNEIGANIALIDRLMGVSS